jgi:GNAT superfamily N-acetyltransferase
MFGQTVWDVRRDLGVGPALPEVVMPSSVQFKVYGPEARELVVGYLEREFRGRWARDVGHYLAIPGAMGAVMAMEYESAIAGFSMLHPPGSTGALRWAGFNPHIAALGPIGVSRSLRGQGLGLGLLVAGLAWLKDQGARDMVIDWTTLLAFYGKAGFEPWLSYRLCEKML